MTRTRRLAAAYIALAAAVAVLFALNLFWGSVSLAPGAVLTALAGQGRRCACGEHHPAAAPAPRGHGGAVGGEPSRAAGYPAADFFCKPHCRAICYGRFQRRKAGGGPDHGGVSGPRDADQLGHDDRGCLCGCMASMAFVLAVARRVQRMSILVICGVMIGYICSAITDIVVAFAQDSNIVNLHNWSQGSFSGVTWANVQAAALVVLPALAASFLLSKPMAAYQMGEAYAAAWA